MTRILKYSVNCFGKPTFILCHGDQILDIQLQDDEIVCWVESNDALPEQMIKIICIGTGWEIYSETLKNYRYLKTVQDKCGYVWHFYIQKEETLEEE